MILLSSFKQCKHHKSTTGLKDIPLSPQNSGKLLLKRQIETY